MDECTLSIIKPDVTKRNITGKINTMIEDNGYKIIAQKRMFLTKKQAEGFYQEHQERGFYQDLVSYMTSGAVVVQVLQGEDVISGYRKLMGATNPIQAEEGTIRKLFGVSVEANSVHGSDSATSSNREISYFFAQTELID